MEDILETGLKVESGNLFDEEPALRRLVEQALERRRDLSRGLSEDMERVLVSQIVEQVKSRPATRPYSGDKKRKGEGRGAGNV